MSRLFTFLVPLVGALILGAASGRAEDAPPLPDFASFQLRPLPLAQWLRDDAITVVTSAHDIGEIKDIFDGNEVTLLRSTQINPQLTTVQFEEPVSLAGTRVLISHHVGRWKLEGLVWLPDAKEPVKREIVPWTPSLDWQNNEIIFPRNLSVSEVTLTVQRIGGDEYVHLNEWALLTEVPPTPNPPTPSPQTK